MGAAYLFPKTPRSTLHSKSCSVHLPIFVGLAHGALRSSPECRPPPIKHTSIFRPRFVLYRYFLEVIDGEVDWPEALVQRLINCWLANFIHKALFACLDCQVCPLGIDKGAFVCSAS